VTLDFGAKCFRHIEAGTSATSANCPARMPQALPLAVCPYPSMLLVMS
jgi:hypothetical protein